MDSYYKRMQPLLGTFVEVGVNSSLRSERTVSEAFEKIQEVHKKLSFHQLESELNLLNFSQGKELELSRVTINALRLAKGIGRLSDDKFNCTVGNWFKKVDESTLAINNLASSGTSNDLIIRGRKARLTQGITLILDGIAKGLAVDLAVKSLIQNGAEYGWVNAGGDLKVFGDRSWPVQISNSSGDARPIFLKNMAIATSSFSTVDDSRFPAKIISSNIQEGSSLGTWSVISKSAWRADALTKVAANSCNAERATNVKKLGGILVQAETVLS